MGRGLQMKKSNSRGDSTIELLKKEVSTHGDSLKILSIERLHELKGEIESFAENEELNRFQKYIVSNIYELELPAADFEIRSIIIIAVPCPSYANVEFIWQGKKYLTSSLVRANMNGEDAFEVAKQYLENYLGPRGYHMKCAMKLPLKRLAARSGLASYGRNNICYVEGMGSFLALFAYFTDMECIKDDWTEISNASICENCRACINSCPTGAISNEKFLLNNERCLSYYNESPGEFPEWIPLSAHHCLYDCLKCQINCPMNTDYVDNVIGPIEFSEEETHMILSGGKFYGFSPALQKKVKLLGMDEWLEAIPRNLRILLS